MRNAGLEEAQAGIKIAGRNINSLKYADDTTLMAESEEELKSLLMKVKEESKKAGLKLSIQKTKIMASNLITSCHVSWRNNGNSQRLFSCAPKLLWVVALNMKLKDPFSLEEKLVKPRHYIKKQRHYYAYKGLYSQSYGFSSSPKQM